MIINNPKDLVEKIQKKKEINFIPTMGNLHEGHLNLLKIAKNKEHFSLVSIFVNPLQFSEKKDYDNYPRTLNNDLSLLKKNGVDLVFLPDSNFLDDSDNIKESINTEPLFKRLCGIDRPGHFFGVTAIMIKFLKLIKPSFLTLGEKDFQQFLIIKKLINKYFPKTKIILSPIIREKSGLALSSRNKLISKKKIKSAVKIFKFMELISERIEKSGLEYSELKLLQKKFLNEGFDKVNYLEVLKEETLGDLNKVPSKARIFLSATIDGIRLIDNYSIRKKVVLEDKTIKKT